MSQYGLDLIEILDNFVEFKRSIKSLAYIGTHDHGEELERIATLDDSDEENPKHLKFKISVVDKEISSPFKSISTKYDWVTCIEHDLTQEVRLPFSNRKFDIMWLSNILQLVPDPLGFLRLVSKNTAKNGMLYISVPQTIGYNRRTPRNYWYSGQINNFSVTQLIYFIAICGFDVKDFYCKKLTYDDQIQLVTYKNTDCYEGIPSWSDLAEKNIFNDNINEVISNHDFLTDQGLRTMWLDGTIYDYRYTNT